MPRPTPMISRRLKRPISDTLPVPIVEEQKGELIIYYGDGEGKTSAALGHTVRSLGHGQTVRIFCFLKGRTNMGEYLHLQQHENVAIELCGAVKFIVGKKNLELHERLTKECLKKVRKILHDQSCDLLILDEILYTLHFKLITLKELLDIVDSRGKMHVILTGGRRIPASLFRRAYLVTQMKKRKHEYDVQKKTVLFIDY